MSVGCTRAARRGSFVLEGVPLYVLANRKHTAPLASAALPVFQPYAVNPRVASDLFLQRRRLTTHQNEFWQRNGALE